MDIIFMGTPEFAVYALETLIASPHRVVAVYTQPPRPAGRGQKEQPSPVQKLAEMHHIPVCSPLSLKTPEIQAEFAAWKADVAVVAAYGLILPEAILRANKFGCINIHPSLLPRWRGAAPIQRAVLAGDRETGVAIMQMDKGLDTGDILRMETLPLPDGMTAGELHDNLAKQGASLLLKVLDGLENGNINPQKQSADGVTYAEKIRKEEAKINWNRSASEVLNLICGLSPWPGAYMEYKGERIKILKAETISTNNRLHPGTVLDDNFTVACTGGAIRPLLVQRAGRGAIDTASLLRGFPIPKGTKL